MDSNKGPKLDKSWQTAMVAVGLAFSLPGAFAGPILIGYFLDKYFVTTPILVIIGLFLGSFTAIAEVYLVMKKINTLK